MPKLLSFTAFIDKEKLNEALINRIPEKRDQAVTKNEGYENPQHYEKNSEKLGEYKGLHIYVSKTSGGGMKHFTWSPHDKKIHHVLYAAQASQENGKTRLQFLSAHSRKESPVRMSEIYKELIVNHGREMVGTSHSPGAIKMWNRLHADNELEMYGLHSNGHVEKLTLNSTKYVNYADANKTPQNKSIARMKLLLTKKNN